MSAIVTIIREGTSESIQVYVDPNEKIKDVIDRCKDYWRLEGTTEDYVLIKNNMKLSRQKTVISSDLKEGDVLRFTGKGSSTSREETEEQRREDDPVAVSKEWLSENLGLETDELETIEKRESESSLKMVFKDVDRDQHYTIITKNSVVKTYIPAYVEDLDIEGV
ncbi:MAG: hypothetical protein ACLFSM_09160 [Thermoplasmata archaeon]